MVGICPDTLAIPRVDNAGVVSNGSITMHNGVIIALGSYYGEPMARLLRENRGVHEPQEERVFESVIKTIPPGGVMIELGSYWGFYSLSFANTVPDARCILVEPSLSNLQYGKSNFKLNERKAEFIHAYVGADGAGIQDGVQVVTVEGICESRSIKTLDMLHADIQGAELDMLDGAQSLFSEQRVNFSFISTHSEALHKDVRHRLLAWGYRVIADIPPAQSYSEDGLIAVSAPSTNFQLGYKVSLFRVT